MEKDDYSETLYWITTEEAKAMQLIPIRCIYYRNDFKDKKFRLYIADNHAYVHEHFKSFEAFVKGSDELVKSHHKYTGIGDMYFVKDGEDNEEHFLSHFDELDKPYLKRYIHTNYATQFTTKEDIEKFIKFMQASLHVRLEERDSEKKERDAVFGWSEKELNF